MAGTSDHLDIKELPFLSRSIGDRTSEPAECFWYSHKVLLHQSLPAQANLAITACKRSKHATSLNPAQNTTPIQMERSLNAFTHNMSVRLPEPQLKSSREYQGCVASRAHLISLHPPRPLSPLARDRRLTDAFYTRFRHLLGLSSDAGNDGTAFWSPDSEHHGFKRRVWPTRRTSNRCVACDLVVLSSFPSFLRLFLDGECAVHM